MIIKHKTEKWIRKCYGLVLLSNGALKLIINDSVNENYLDFEILENELGENFRFYNNLLPVKNYNQGEIVAIIGDKRIFEPDPFKAYIELLEGGMAQQELVKLEMEEK